LLSAALLERDVRSSLVCGVVTGSLPAELDQLRKIELLPRLFPLWAGGH
jgi:hypothetical protein